MIPSTIIVWIGMSVAVVAAYFVIHAMTMVVYHIIDIFRRTYWFVTDKDDLCEYPEISDIA